MNTDATQDVRSIEQLEADLAELSAKRAVPDREIRTTVTRVVVTAGNESPVFGEDAIVLQINDEAAGPFLEMFHPGCEERPVKFDFDQIDAIVNAMRHLAAIARGMEAGHA